MRLSINKHRREALLSTASMPPTLMVIPALFAVAQQVTRLPSVLYSKTAPLSVHR
jgi:hypothetical protein